MRHAARSNPKILWSISDQSQETPAHHQISAGSENHQHTWVEGMNRGDVSAADRAFAPDCVIHINGSPEPNLSLGGFKEMVSGLLGAFPDLRFTIEDQIVAGDKVATRWTAEGTNSGAFGSVPAT